MNSPSREEFDAKLATTAAQIETSEAKVDARLAEFDTSVKTGFAELRADISRMQMEMHKNTLDIIRWGIGVALTMAAISISVLTFVVKNSAEKGGEKARIVIYAQPQAPVAPPAAIDK